MIQEGLKGMEALRIREPLSQASTLLNHWRIFVGLCLVNDS